MWRTIPLTKIVLRMLVFGAVLGLLLGLLTKFAFDSTIPAPRSFYLPQIIKGGVFDGVILGALIGIALALYAGVLHRTSHKPHLFKFAFVIIATIGSLAIVQQPFHIGTLAEIGFDWSWALLDSVLRTIIIVTVLKHVAFGLASLFVASRYLHEVSAHLMRSKAQLASV